MMYMFFFPYYSEVTDGYSVGCNNVCFICFDQQSNLPTNGLILNILLKKVQHDTECDKAGSLEYRSK